MLLLEQLVQRALLPHDFVLSFRPAGLDFHLQGAEFLVALLFHVRFYFAQADLHGFVQHGQVA